MMKKLLPVILVLLSTTAFAQSQKTNEQDAPAKGALAIGRLKSIVLTGGSVVDVAKGQVQPGVTVVITGGRITEMGPAGKVRRPRGAQVVNAIGRYLIPGLWDMHVHLGKDGETVLPLYLANGVTSVREMGGGEFAKVKLWREKVAAGALLGPRIKAASPILESKLFTQRLERLTGESQTGLRIGIGSPADAPQAIESIAGMGVDFVKIRTSASREAYLAIASEVRRVGLALVGHAPTVVSLVEAADAGQRSIEHGFMLFSDYSDEKWKEIEASFVKNGTHIVPTLVSGRSFRETPDDQVIKVIDDNTGALDPRRKYVSASLSDFWRKQMDMKKAETPMDWTPIIARNKQALRRLHRVGVRMMAGTDVGVPLIYPGFSLHEELELLVKDVGLTPAEALRSATLLPAEFMGLQETLGTVERGKIADLVLLEGNPLESISNTQKIAAVVAGGRLLNESDLQALLAKVAASVKKPPETRTSGVPPGSPELERRDQAATPEDLQILNRADDILSDQSKWNRKDDRNCAPGAKDWSLFCALEKASIEVLGEYQHRRVSLQEMRFVIEEISMGREFEHRLMEFNNLATTRFEDIKKVLKLAAERVAARLSGR